VAIAVFAYWATMVGTTAPTPLYPLYRAEFGFSSLMTTVLFAVYAIGVVAGMLAFGRLSDEIGRKPVIGIALGLSALAAVGFLTAQNVGMMLVARVISGFGAALVTGAGTAVIVELMPVQQRTRASLISIAAGMGGLGSGNLLAGILAEWAPSPLHLIWWVVIGFSVVGALGLSLIPETVIKPTGFQFHMPRLRVPAEIRGGFFRAAITGGTGFSVLGVLTAITGLFLGQELHNRNHAVTGLVVSLAFFGILFGQLTVRRLSGELVMPVALVGLLAGAVLIGVALDLRAITPLIAGALITGISVGFALAHGLSEITAGAPPAQRGEAISTFFAIQYTMLALPAIGVGVLIQIVGLRPAGMIFAGLVAALSVVVLMSMLRHNAPAAHQTAGAD
jgi:MFS family permease